MTDRDLCFIPATALQRLYRTRKVSPLEVMQAVFARIDAVNPRLNAYVTVAREPALAAAKKATAALTQGHGFAGWARPAGVLVGGVLALRRAPFPVVIVAAAATTAGLRLAGIP